MGEGGTPITDDELLYRRIPIQPGYYDAGVSPKPSRLAFRPGRHDRTGLSLYRAKHKTATEVARMGRKDQYYVAVLRAGDLRASDLQVVPAEVEPGDGHAEIPLIRYENRKSTEVEEAITRLEYDLCLEVLGPLP